MVLSLCCYCLVTICCVSTHFVNWDLCTCMLQASCLYIVVCTLRVGSLHVKVGRIALQFTQPLISIPVHSTAWFEI